MANPYLHPAQPRRNHLLAALPPEELATLLPRMERVELTVQQVLHRPEQPITAVYFPETGWISTLQLLCDGGAAEVGHAGREGMAGLPLLFGVDSSSAESIVQASGTALRLSAEAFHEALERCPAFRSLLLRYALAFNEEVAQTAACNGRHVLEQRLARWLLMAHDRSEGDEVPMTQDFLAIMLCVQRPGVTLAVGHLQAAGYIRVGRGRITVTDRAGLEDTACECYATVRRPLRGIAWYCDGLGRRASAPCGNLVAPGGRPDKGDLSHRPMSLSRITAIIKMVC